jgi:hypothetical protein
VEKNIRAHSVQESKILGVDGILSGTQRKSDSAAEGEARVCVGDAGDIAINVTP